MNASRCAFALSLFAAAGPFPRPSRWRLTLGLLAVAAALGSSCGGDDSAGNSGKTTGGLGGTDSGGDSTGGTSADSGSGGTPGSDGVAGTGGATCGGSLCESYKAGGLFLLKACCAGSSNAECGVTLGEEIAKFVGLPQGCYALDQPGNWDSSCPPLAAQNTFGGQGLLWGCCNSATSTCGIALDLEELGFYNVGFSPGPSFGCVDTTGVVDGSSKSCTPAVGEGGSPEGGLFGCPSGNAVVLASAQPSPAAIAVDATHVYWATAYTIMKAPIGGGTPTLLAAQGGGAIALDTTDLYWTNEGDATVAKLPIDGGTPTLLAAEGGSLIAVDTTSVYWATAGSIRKVPIGGGVPTTLVAAQKPTGIAVDTSSVYWTTESSLLKLPLGGGSTTTLSTSFGSPKGVTTDGKNVYWVTQPPTGGYSGNGGGLGKVMKVPVSGGTATTLHSGTYRPLAIAADADSAYWVNAATGATEGSVMKVALGGGPPVKLACGQKPTAIAVDATSVYWTNSDGTVLKIPK